MFYLVNRGALVVEVGGYVVQHEVADVLDVVAVCHLVPWVWSENLVKMNFHFFNCVGTS